MACLIYFFYFLFFIILMFLVGKNHYFLFKLQTIHISFRNDDVSFLFLFLFLLICLCVCVCVMYKGKISTNHIYKLYCYTHKLLHISLIIGPERVPLKLDSTSLRGSQVKVQAKALKGLIHGALKSQPRCSQRSAEVP